MNRIPALAVSAMLILCRCTDAGPVSGAAARAGFEAGVALLGDRHLNFENLPAGTALDNEFAASHGVMFSSIRYVNGSALTPPHEVVVSAAFSASRGNTIVGTPCTGCSDDGRVAYQIVFNSPQRRAGLERLWSTNTLTRFYAQSGALLHQFTGLGYAFVAYLAESDDTNIWVKRIEIDGTGGAFNYQVGYSDDLFFGTAALNQPALRLTATNAVTLTLIGQPSGQYMVEVRNSFSATNNWTTLTNVTLTNSSIPVADPNATNSHHRFYRVSPVTH